MHPYIEFVNPYLGKMLQEIGLDKRFVQGSGSLLYDELGNEYLDCIAAYGALPFGYNPPKIWEAIRDVEARGEPSFIQPSLLEGAGELGARLIGIAPPGLSYVTFSNSGAEAVEAAFKLCRAKTGKKYILSTANSFHGKTLGALSATGNPSYQSAFSAPVSGFRHIPYGDLGALEDYLKKHAFETAAFILEPIQGEGGIVEPPQGYLRAVQNLCENYGVLTILDEIQTGLGRTGTMFACEKEGITPDVMVLAKALGGGLVPIGATLCKGDVYTEEFGLKHSSTFAGNALGCRVGLAVIDLLTANDTRLIKEIARKGDLLKAGLKEVTEPYLDIISSIRGQGLMLGIEFNNSKGPYPHSLLGVMAEQELLTPIVSSYLLNVERIRVAPTLNGASVIRIEPALTITDDQISQIVVGVKNMVQRLAERNTAAFLGHLVDFKCDASNSQLTKIVRTTEPKSQQQDGRFAFLVHPVDLRNYSDFDASLALLGEEQLANLSTRWNDLVEPFVVSGTRVVDHKGQSAYGEFICVPRTAQQLLELSAEKALAEIKQAVDLAVSRGAQIVGLGAYTSVVTMGGRRLLSHTDVALTTGNSYTVVSGVEAVLSAAQKLGLELKDLNAAVVGAGGAIGKASALLLAEQVRKLILIGNPARAERSEYRLLRVAVEIFQHLRDLVKSGHQFAPDTLGSFVAQLSDFPNVDSLPELTDYIRPLLQGDGPLVITLASAENLPQADIILAATSSLDTLITSQMLKQGALVCDMSTPSNVAKEVLEERPDVLVIDGGIVAVPNSPDLGWNFGFGPGEAYACMSETMMLALEKRFVHSSLGADLNLDQLKLVRNLAQEQGFTLAGFRSFDRPLPPSVWERVQNYK